jgi:DNA-binding NarL/FixJ family response regulator
VSTAHILIVDDHAIIRRGLRFIIESNFQNCIIDGAEDIKGLIQKLSENRYTHLILDLQLEDGNSINQFLEIREKYPDLLVMVYTMSPEEIFGKRLMQMGAAGFLTKQSSEEEVIKALHLFLGGRKYVSERIHELMKNEKPGASARKNPFEDLSDREMAVVFNLLKGKGVKEIAAELNLKSTTVATYKARIFDKMGVTNILELHQLSQLFHFAE